MIEDIDAKFEQIKARLKARSSTQGSLHHYSGSGGAIKVTVIRGSVEDANSHSGEVVEVKKFGDQQKTKNEETESNAMSGITNCKIDKRDFQMFEEINKQDVDQEQ